MPYELMPIIIVYVLEYRRLFHPKNTQNYSPILRYKMKLRFPTNTSITTLFLKRPASATIVPSPLIYEFSHSFAFIHMFNHILKTSLFLFALFFNLCLALFLFLRLNSSISQTCF